MAQQTTNMDPSAGSLTRFLRATEIDTRLLGMVGALLLIWVGFHLYGVVVNGEAARSSRRATCGTSRSRPRPSGSWPAGMVLVIIMRHIDLSVGSMLGFCAMMMGMLQVEWYPQLVGLGHPTIVVLTILSGPCRRHGDRRLPGLARRLSRHPGLHRHAGRPADLARRGVPSGRRAHDLSGRRELRAAGRRALRRPSGATASGWWVCSAARRSCGCCLGPAEPAAATASRSGRSGPNTCSPALGCGICIGATLLVNAYPWPKGIVEQYAAANGDHRARGRAVHQPRLRGAGADPVWAWRS